MKANELRFGNYIDTPSIKSERVTGLSTNICTTENNQVSYDCAYPIPLTEEWLLRFGFRKRSKNFYIKNNKTEWKKLSFQIEIYPEQTTFNSCRIYQDNYQDAVEVKPLEYIHQLQNLYFALTGEELTIK